jgi:hypothetical protein
MTLVERLRENAHLGLKMHALEAADEIERLQGENYRLTMECDGLRQDMATAAAEGREAYDALRAANKKLKQDARRYRWWCAAIADAAIEADRRDG